MSQREGEQGRILIVDDDESTRRTLTLIFERCDYETEAARSGREALERAARGSFHVALLDIQLPDMAGIELIAPLKKHHPDLVAIMLTAHASLETAVRALNEGATAYLLKPVNMEEVLATVREGVRKQQLIAENKRLFAQAQQELAMRKQAEEERERLRTQLYQTDRMASLGMLAASVAHEINNPLAYLIYNVESLTEDLPGMALALDRLHNVAIRELGADGAGQLLGELRRFTVAGLLEDVVQRARDAAEGARRVLTIARDLRTFSHVQEDRRVPLSLNQVIESAINMAVHEFKHRARLVKEYGDLPTVMASEGRLSQVFLNLLLNAAHAIHDGDAERNEIRVRTWAEGDEVRVEVRDTGRGVAPEHLKKIFEPFFTTKEAGVGSGLGLTICHNIITAYGGRIDVESEVGKGTRVVVRLPRRSMEEAAAAQSPAAAPAPELPEGTPRARILIVDDEPFFCAALRRMLKEEFEVVVASSGVEGREVLERDTGFDVILCDLLMPRVTGMTLYERLFVLRPDVARRMIFMTGGACTPQARSFLQKVPNLHVEKPFELHYLRGLLLQLLSRRA